MSPHSEIFVDESGGGIGKWRTLGVHLVYLCLFPDFSPMNLHGLRKSKQGARAGACPSLLPGILHVIVHVGNGSGRAVFQSFKIVHFDSEPACH